MKKTGNTPEATSDNTAKEDVNKPAAPAQETPDATPEAESAASADPAQPDVQEQAPEKAPEPTAEKPAPAERTTAPASPAPAQTDAPATWPGKVALVISLAALGASGWLYWQSLQSKQEESATLTRLNSQVAAVADSTKSQLADAKALISTQVNAVNQNMTLLQNQSAKEQQSIAELQERLTQSIQQVMAKQSNTRKDWLLAETEYLLRLANQRILMENTSVGALALLKSADTILKETDDVSIYAVRKALASDIAALEAVPTFDLEGSYLKLAAMAEQVNNLRLVPLTDKNKLPSLIEQITPESVSESWTQGLKTSWANAMAKLEKLIVIQHRDEQIEPLLSPEQTYYLQQNLHLMLEQAQLALLRKEQATFDRSLDKASKWVSTYFEAEDPTTQALLRGIDDVKTLKISPQLPDISGSLNALKSYLQQMTALKEGAAQ